MRREQPHSCSRRTWTAPSVEYLSLPNIYGPLASPFVLGNKWDTCVFLFSLQRARACAGVRVTAQCMPFWCTCVSVCLGAGRQGVGALGYNPVAFAYHAIRGRLLRSREARRPRPLDSSIRALRSIPPIPSRTLAPRCCFVYLFYNFTMEWHNKKLYLAFHFVCCSSHYLPCHSTSRSPGRH